MWHMGAINGRSKESIFKITEEMARKLENYNIKRTGQLCMTNLNLSIDTNRPKSMMQLVNDHPLSFPA